MRRVLQSVLIAFPVIAFLASPVHAAEGQDVLWAVSGAHNTVYLLGSIHVLRVSDSVLPRAAQQAYADAEQLYEEIDLLAAAGDQLGADSMALQILPDGQTLASILGPALFAEFRTAAHALGMDTDYMNRFQPWFAAMSLQAVQMLREGYSPQSGVDYQIAQNARRDHKPVRGLETLKDQLSLFAGLSMDEQREFLADTLHESDSSQELEEVTRAWRRGDLSKLEELLRKGTAESPQLYKALTTDRNLRWLPQIEQMLQAPEDFLVVVGALHMVGESGLVALLKQRGYRVERR
jgi:uncharacterized protein